MMLRRFSRIAAASGLTVLAGCSDPASLPAQAAIELTVSNVDGCYTPGEAFALPPDGPSITSLRGNTASEARKYLIADGEGDTTISCSIGGDGTLRAAINKPRNLVFTLSGQIDANTGKGTATISEWHAGGSQVSGQCTLEKKSLTEGAIWATFDCPMFAAEMQVCSGEGTFIFENCE